MAQHQQPQFPFSSPSPSKSGSSEEEKQWEHDLDDNYYESRKCATTSNEVLLPSKPNEEHIYWITARSKSPETPKPKSIIEDSGKWLIFEYPWVIDKAWEKIKNAVEAGLLGHFAKVNTTKPKPVELGGGSNNHVICVYTTSNFEEREKVRMELFKLGYHESLCYKTDSDTLAGNYKHGKIFDNYYKIYEEKNGTTLVLYEGKFYKVKNKEKLISFLKDGHFEDSPSEWMFEDDFKVLQANKGKGVTSSSYMQNHFIDPRPSCNPSRSEHYYFRFETRKTPFGRTMIYIKQKNLESNPSNPSLQLCWDKDKESKLLEVDLYDLFRIPFDSTVKDRDFSVKGKNTNLSISLELKYSDNFDDYSIEFRGKGYKDKSIVLIPLKDAAFCHKLLVCNYL